MAFHWKEHDVEKRDMTESGVETEKAYSHLNNDLQRFFSPS